MPSFDTIARLYEPLERLTFGNTLQTARCHCLKFLPETETCLLIGDGDGRFASTLLSTHHRCKIDSIDISANMLELSKKRAGEYAERLNPICSDALTYPYPTDKYDFIGLHFCIDCFRQAELDLLLSKIVPALKPGGLIAYSDFQGTKPWHRTIVRFLYFSFRYSAGLKVSRLPTPNWGSQLKRVKHKEFLGGLVFSTLLQYSNTSATDPENR